jgi:ribose 5-phosphate isomerase B
MGANLPGYAKGIGMSDISDLEIQQIVRRVLHQALGLNKPEPVNSSQPVQPQPAPTGEPKLAGRRVVAIGADHGGFDLKELLKPDLISSGFDILDVGASSKEAVDYPDIAHEVARLVGTGKAFRGIVIDGAGIGSCIVANKVPGVRAGLAYDYSSAVNGREHNDTNVLTLGAGLIGAALARQVVKIWLATEFGGGRHSKRVDKIGAVEKLYLKSS